jgi:hypothetical protein
MGWTHTRALIAHAKSVDANADVTELRRQLKAERLALHIQQVANSAPQLSDEQRAELAALLRSGG